MFFSEEGGSPPGKNQKTFMFPPLLRLVDLAGEVALAQT